MSCGDIVELPVGNVNDEEFSEVSGAEMVATANPKLGRDTSIAVISDSIVEIRFETTPRILDSRGRASENIQLKMRFDGFRIGPDGIQLTKEDDSESVFLTTHNAGYTGRERTGASDVAHKAQDLFRNLCAEKLFKDSRVIPIRRIGARIKSLTPIKGSFAELREKIVSTFGEPSSELTDILSGSMSDVSYVYDFRDSDGKMRITVGPMRDEQMVTYFERGDDHSIPEIGLFLDIDVYKEVKGTSSDATVLEYINRYCEKVWKTQDKIVELILGV